jgi:hypothetical protein
MLRSPINSHSTSLSRINVLVNRAAGERAWRLMSRVLSGELEYPSSGYVTCTPFALRESSICRAGASPCCIHLRTRQRTIKKGGARRAALFPNAPAATLARAGCSGIQLPAGVLASGRARPIRIRIRTGNTAGCSRPAGSGPTRRRDRSTDAL